LGNRQLRRAPGADRAFRRGDRVHCADRAGRDALFRAAGCGATGIGRLGGIVAAPLGGYLLSLGLPPPFIFLSACVFAAIAAVATALLALPARQLAAIPAAKETA
jgi:hypothetical protein